MTPRAATSRHSSRWKLETIDRPPVSPFLQVDGIGISAVFIDHSSMDSAPRIYVDKSHGRIEKEATGTRLHGTHAFRSVFHRLNG